MPLDPSTLESFYSLLLGFTFAGLLANAFELFTERRASFHLLQTGSLRAVAYVPVVVFSAPFIILRNTVRGRRFERRSVGVVMGATIVAGLWSLMSGRIVLDVTQLLAGA